MDATATAFSGTNSINGRKTSYRKAIHMRNALMLMGLCWMIWQYAHSPSVFNMLAVGTWTVVTGVYLLLVRPHDYV
jgi:hypothetical protein